jgi:MoxR-like ATPase
MMTIEELAHRWGISAGELLEKADALGMHKKDVGSEVNPDEQRDLKRVRNVTPGQIETLVRHATKERRIIVPVPEMPWKKATVNAQANRQVSPNERAFKKDDLTAIQDELARMESVVASLQVHSRSEMENLLKEALRASDMESLISRQVENTLKPMLESSTVNTSMAHRVEALVKADMLTDLRKEVQSTVSREIQRLGVFWPEHDDEMRQLPEVQNRISAIGDDIQKVRTKTDELQMTIEMARRSTEERLQRLTAQLKEAQEGHAHAAHMERQYNEAQQRVGWLDKSVRDLQDAVGAFQAADTPGRIEAIRADVKRITLAQERASKELTACADAVREVGQSISQMQEDVGRLKVQCSAIRAHNDESRSQIRQLREAAARSQTLVAPELRVDVDECMRYLEDNSLFFERDTVADCISAITNGYMLLLTGPPGTGKTSLANILPTVFFRGQSEGLLTVQEADHSWHSFDVLGGKWVIGQDIVPRPGVFTRAVLKSVERGGRHWLFIDELNRADADRAFSGILSALDNPLQGSYISLPELSVSIKIPSSFRLICAMNESDSRYLFPIGTALLNRFRRVRVPSPSRELEERIVRRKVFPSLTKKTGMRGVLSIFHRSDEASLGEQIESVLQEYLDAVHGIREIGVKSGVRELQIGVRSTIKIFRTIADQVNAPAEHVHKLMDTLLCSEIMPGIGRAPP